MQFASAVSLKGKCDEAGREAPTVKNPSSKHEQEKQDRAERMVRDAEGSWADDLGLGVTYLAKGSYAKQRWRGVRPQP